MRYTDKPNQGQHLLFHRLLAPVLFFTGAVFIFCGIFGTTAFADGFGGWSERHTIDSTCSDPFDVTTADFDNDKDMDIAVAESHQVVWYANNGTQSFTEYTVTGSLTGTVSVYAADVDGDGDTDILGADETLDYVFWCENDGSPANGTWEKHILPGEFNGARSVSCLDINDDGDMDVLAAAKDGDTIAWWENDGDENFTYHSIDEDYKAYDVIATDIDGDGDIDIVGVAGNEAITWWANNGSANFRPHVVDAGFTSGYAVHTGDIDGDDDIDIVASVGEGPGSLTWWANDGTPGNGGWVAENLTDVYVCWSVQAVDLDSDDDMDVLSGSLSGYEVDWWDNDGSESFTKSTVADEFEPASLRASDIDQDGWYDVVGVDAGEPGGSTDILAWWENQNEGQGPVPPVPELPALVLLGCGMVVAAGFIMYKQRRQAETPARW